jgi:hypothetical protein
MSEELLAHKVVGLNHTLHIALQTGWNAIWMQTRNASNLVNADSDTHEQMLREGEKPQVLDVEFRGLNGTKRPVDARR